jgi:hypothetical protein
MRLGKIAHQHQNNAHNHTTPKAGTIMRDTFCC